ncbi:MAG TPA: FliM/FliN family flagellar motor switch protein [Terracidiphilus sp.]|nr:FliM/FliN family flagellar motor switch protein [Terracidiphilus sp.]
MTYFDCWKSVAEALFSQALTGEPTLSASLPTPLGAGAFGFSAVLCGEVEGRFSVLLDPSLLEAALVGEGVDQKAGWKDLLREVVDAAAGDLLARTGARCRVESFDEMDGANQVTQAFQLKAGDRSWQLAVIDQLRARGKEAAEAAAAPGETSSPPSAFPAESSTLAAGGTHSPGFGLLLDVELEAALRFGCREMPLGEILDLGPGDVVVLDRHVSDPVDLIVGDKIVARGEVVLVNGNFGLRVTEVAEPRRRLESIRCLF